MNDVSVVMCTYNGAAFVEEQLASILSQTHAPAEIIVRDDGSTDSTLDIVRRIVAASHIPVRCAVNATRLGFADNFLTACRAAKGTYIAFSDQDDRWKDRKLELSCEALERRHANLCVHPVELIDSAGALISRQASTGAEKLLERPDPLGNFYGFTMTFRRSLLDKIPAGLRGLDPHTRGAPLSHDRWVYFLATTFGRTVILGEHLAQYRQHGDQLYGGERARSLGERITTKIAAGEAQSVYLAEFAAHLSRLLSTPPAGEDITAWRTGESRWRRLEKTYLRRAHFYGRRSTMKRASSLIGNVQEGIYAPQASGGLGGRGLLEDVTVVLASGLAGRRVA